ncbi:hypothetical protein QYF61_016920 [Mycteria americana]|uniref:Uncharacterized protein n=1 Tax=Mycteria americana TaxID=33587 RepID=A0AAN7RXT9_MYCAM|nr:hypothetical protein QYF61_016920 [Mycteria americana]
MKRTAAVSRNTGREVTQPSCCVVNRGWLLHILSPILPGGRRGRKGASLSGCWPPCLPAPPPASLATSLPLGSACCVATAGSALGRWGPCPALLNQQCSTFLAENKVSKQFKNIIQRRAPRLDSYEWQGVWDSMGKCLEREETPTKKGKEEEVDEAGYSEAEASQEEEEEEAELINEVVATRFLSLSELRVMQKDFSHRPDEHIVTWLLQCWDNGASSLE